MASNNNNNKGSVTNRIKAKITGKLKPNLAPLPNKPHAAPKKSKKNKQKMKRLGKSFRDGRDGSNSPSTSSMNSGRTSFEGLNNDVSLDQLNEASPDVSDKEEVAVENNDDSGFISLDIDSDDAKSVHTTTFDKFEAELPDEDDNNTGLDDDYSTGVPTTGDKRKRTDDNDDDDGSLMVPIVENDYPWIRNHDRSNCRETSDWLSFEIRDFVAYMSPSAHEIEARNYTVRRVRELVQDTWRDAEARVFGSYATDLYLPGSDIDMVVVSDSGRLDDKKSLYTLSSKLRSKGIAKNMEVIAKARVPIIKMVDSETNIKIDISFERRNGLNAVRTIESWIQKYPSMRYFVYVIKQFLAKRRLNEVHTGGLGGFAVICMVTSFLANHPRIQSNDINVDDNLGVLLIEFFELYGKSFNYYDVALCMSGDMRYKRKSYNSHLQGQNPFSLAIEDPNDNTNNLSRGTFNIRGIKKAFIGGYEVLTSRCYELEYMPFKKRKGQSILGYLIKQVKGPIRDFEDSRDVVRNEAQDVVRSKAKSSREWKRASAGEKSSSSTSTTAPPPLPPKKKVKKEVVYINGDSESEEEKKEQEKPRKEVKKNDAVKLDGSDSDQGYSESSEDEDENSRTRATSVDKERKRQFWLEKSGVVSV